ISLIIKYREERMKKVFIIAATFAQLVVNATEPDAAGVLIVSNNVADRQFSGREDVEIVKIEKNPQLTSIGEAAFNNCSALKSIYIPNTVTELGNFCFESCTSLESVEFEGNSQITSIKDFVFRECSSLKSICIPNTVMELGNFCFHDCTSLESVKFEKNSQITSIGFSVFERCRSLKAICIPRSVEKLGWEEDFSIRSLFPYQGYTFSGCISLESVTFEKNSNLRYIRHYTFGGCVALKSICLPRSVTEIDDYCFSDCTALESVKFEANSRPEHIGASAFIGCHALKISSFIRRRIEPRIIKPRIRIYKIRN
ncbi:MAG: leucine-rich repeat domain-containing protein, partial [Holosporaceae bacterium]|nr:leucine-rich repeat domain-containing protein [Holosporaceae bacterium]